jgi:hypothetical protein
MIPISPDRTPTTDDAVDRLGHTHCKSLTAARERLGMSGLDDEVNVVGLHAEVDHAERPSRSVGERLQHGSRDRTTAKRRESGDGARRDVYRHARIMRDPAPMRYASTPSPGRSTRPRTAAAPRGEDERELWHV